ncbi:unnamed protein product, partial [Mesorhabditis belari]|uniref:Ribonuclease P protein subunit p29 n=1 Tax=Mesorhabditis belari TaxID=2138241 RepID=A0AAF3F5I7_9BILA
MRLDKKYVYFEATKPPKRPPRRQKTNLVRNRLTAEDKKQLKYSQFEPLYELWCKYFGEMAPADRQIDEKLLKADFHGALLMITEADNKCQVGIAGIVVLETRYTMQLITREDKFLIIPKQGTVFQFILEGRVFSLFGDQMRQRAELRGRKARLRKALPIFLR